VLYVLLKGQAPRTHDTPSPSCILQKEHK
jgi:hypothetical protein